ncbi:MAG: hypothetical protein R3C11_16695 [Planctomycetaceae bacterium]
MKRRRTLFTFWILILSIGSFLAPIGLSTSGSFAQDLLEVPEDKEPVKKEPAKQEKPAEDKKEADSKTPIPLGRTITVESPLNDVVFGRIKNTALALQNQSIQENRKAFLILEITPGDSPFYQVQGLAKFLTSEAVSNVTTIAWIPKTVTGNNAALALVCNEIIMHPDAELGDLGRGKALDLEEQQSLLSLIQKRTNNKVNGSLVKGLMDPQVPLMLVKIEKENQGVESRVVTRDELSQLQNLGVAISDIETIKEAGFAGTLSGARARGLNILVNQTAKEPLGTRIDI